MTSRNLISVYQGAEAIESSDSTDKEKFRLLKKHEVRNLHSFCDIMRGHGCDVSNFDGFYVGYTIGQIGKEFDLLRFGHPAVINIEIKSELKIALKEQKILSQMQKNYYYLKRMGHPLNMYTYVENDGFYEYDILLDTVDKVDSSIVAACIQNHRADYAINPDREFIPSNYLISPFNSTVSFLNSEYFLTPAQQEIKKQIQNELLTTSFKFFTIHANAGTGKTLLLYDIAKDMMHSLKRIVIIHGGILNEGHEKLVAEYGWIIRSVSYINVQTIDGLLDKCSMLFIDEAQRIRQHQLDLIIQKSINHMIPIVFSYDTKQYLRKDEGRDIEVYLHDNYPEVALSAKKLTTKIRTNKEISSFITNFFNVGKSHDHLNYRCVTIEYMDNINDIREYIAFLQNNNWTAITFTTSQYNTDPFDKLAGICDKSAHSVIGQEFSKVVFVMDNNFKYDEENTLVCRDGFYSAKGMLYQIATRVVDELKIVVLKNVELYFKLLFIKYLGE